MTAMDAISLTLRDGRTLLLRPPVPDDAPALIAFHKQAGGETDYLLSDENGIFGMTEENERAYLEKTLEMPNTRMYLAIVNGQIMGLADVRGEARPRTAHNGSVGIAILRDCWGVGVGSALLGALIAFARANGTLKRLELDTRADNKRAIALYERFGFVACGCAHRHICVRGEYFDSLWMELLL